MRARVMALCAAVALTIGAGGCGLALRPEGPSGPAAGSEEVPTPPGPREHAAGAGSPRQALTRFADAYVNWTAATVAGRLRALARASVGQARAAMELEAAQVAADTQLRQDGVANAGTVQAVAPAADGRYVVVTREQTSASASAIYDGLAPAWHLTLAAVRRQPDGRWVVSGWQPQS